MPTITTTILTLFTLLNLASAGGFKDNCIEHYMYTDCAHLVARCYDDKGLIQASKLDLNQCFMNDDGKIIPADHGRAFGYRCAAKGTGNGCEECAAANGEIRCTCKKTNGELVPAVGNLDSVVTTNNRFLECYGHAAIYA